MKKVTASLAVLLLLAGIVFVLQNNKAKSEAKTRAVAVRPMAVSVVSADRQQLASGLSLIGTISPNREVAVASETVGKVEAASVAVGDFKPVGAVLARVDDELKRSALTMAQVTYEKAKKDLERYTMVQTENAIPDQQIDVANWSVKSAEAQLIAARRQLKDTRITSPISGVIAAKFIEVGTMVQPGTVIASIVDISTLKVRLNVSEHDVFRMHAGDRVEVTTDVYPGVSFFGTINNIGSKGDEAHTYPVEVNIPNTSAHPLKAGMFARVEFTSIPKRMALTIPRQAIVGSVKKPQVYVVNNGTATLRDIMVGDEAGTNIEVLRGLIQGDAVVISGQNNLRDSMRVEIVK